VAQSDLTSWHFGAVGAVGAEVSIGLGCRIRGPKKCGTNFGDGGIQVPVLECEGRY